MDISHESPQQTQARLERVLALAECRTFAAPYAFVETPANAFPEHLTSTALGFVRDDEVWSALVPSDDATAERFFVFSFHFPAGIDNSGFVGWLATLLKQRLGSGVFVMCGSNAGSGGIFDHWGAPLALRDAVVAELQALGARLGTVQ